MRTQINPEEISRVLQPDYPRWPQAFDTYRHHKPYGTRPRILQVNVASTSGLLVCRRCKSRTEILSGLRVVECCSHCGCWDTAWVKEPTYERVRVTGTRGGTSDPYTGRDFCLDLERWCELVADEVFRCVDGAYILELYATPRIGFRDGCEEDQCHGKASIAQILRALGRQISPRTVGRIRACWQASWEGGVVQGLEAASTQDRREHLTGFAPGIRL